MNFYEKLPSFRDFSEIANQDNFRPIPEDWVIVVTDIQGSTRAAREGRFKVVNMLGAAAITILSNEMKSGNTPSIFGGDGATMLMPEATFEKLRPEFVGLMNISRNDFKLELRVGAVKISELLRMGCPLFLGKYQVSGNTSLAQIMGPGCAKAEALVKSADSRAILLNADEMQKDPNLNGLSCRLDKFPTRNGSILSVIVRPVRDGETNWIRNNFIPRTKAILNGDFSSSNPVSTGKLKWRWIPETISSELQLTGRTFGERAKLFLRVVLANFLLKLDISAGGFSSKKYKNEVATQSDFKKFDDSLRMVIDCSERQIDEIEAMLKDAHSAGHVFYGIHKTDHAVLTCVTFSAAAGDHVHFVDGEGCGYTLASVQLKQQMKESVKVL